MFDKVKTQFVQNTLFSKYWKQQNVHILRFTLRKGYRWTKFSGEKQSNSCLFVCFLFYFVLFLFVLFVFVFVFAFVFEKEKEKEKIAKDFRLQAARPSKSDISWIVALFSILQGRDIAVM